MSSRLVAGGTPRLTTSPSGSAPDAARSLRLTAAALYPSSRWVVHASRKWTFSTSASCVTTTPSWSCAASSSIPRARPRRSSSASRPSSPSSESRIDRSAEGMGVRSRADDRDTSGARLDANGRVDRVDPADGYDRDRHGFADPRQAVEPDRWTGVRLRGRGPDGTGTDVGGALAFAFLRLRCRCRRGAEEQARLARPVGSGVVAAEMDAVGVEPYRSLDVVVDRQRAGQVAGA